MSTRSPKEKNSKKESTENVSETIVSPTLVENAELCQQDVMAAGPSGAKSPRIENGVLESLRASLKEEITSKIKLLLLELQKELLDLCDDRPFPVCFHL